MEHFFENIIDAQFDALTEEEQLAIGQQALLAQAGQQPVQQQGQLFPLGLPEAAVLEEPIASEDEGSLLFSDIDTDDESEDESEDEPLFFEEPFEELAVQQELGPLQQALNQIVDVRDHRAVPFEDDNVFNIDALVTLLTRSLKVDEKSEAHTQFLKADAEQETFASFQKEFDDRLTLAFDTQLTGTAEQQLRGIKNVLLTLASVVKQVEDETDINPIQAIEAAIQRVFPREIVDRLEGKAFLNVNVPALINQLFDSDLAALRERNLDNDEILLIKAQFKLDLEELEAILLKDEGLNTLIGEEDVQRGIVFGQNVFNNIRSYVQDNVENPRLKQLLLEDIEKAVFDAREKLGIIFSKRPTSTLSFGKTKTKVLTRDTGIGITSFLARELIEIVEQQTRLNAISAQGDVPPELNDEFADRVFNLARDFNIFAQRNQLKNSEDGEQLFIPTESSDDFDFGDEIDSADIIFDLQDKLRSLLGSEVRFEYLPTTIRDPETGITRERILDDLMKMNRLSAKERFSVRKPKKEIVSSISKRASLRNLEIAQGRRRQRDTGPDDFGAIMRQITIKSDITLSELAMLANMLIMENGSLEDIHEHRLLKITKGVTTIQEVVAEIMLQLKKHLGKDFNILYVPANKHGGLFLDGAFDGIVKNKMLVKPLGGDIFSSIFGTIGNVVKTVASVPLIVASSVFGGSLENPTDPLAKPLFQDNNTFHILPFPFGGTLSGVDNTGFIDHRAKNFAFDMGDVRVNDLNRFPIKAF